MMVVVFALIVPTTTITTVITDITQVYSVQRAEHMVQQVTKYLQGVTPQASWLSFFL